MTIKKDIMSRNSELLSAFIELRNLREEAHEKAVEAIARIEDMDYVIEDIVKILQQKGAGAD